MSINAGRAKLESSRQDFLVAWARVKSVWHDEISAEFEQRFVETADQRIKAAAPAIEELADLINRVQRDCGDD